VCWGPYQTFTQMVAEDARCSPANPLFAEVEQPGIGRYLMPGAPHQFGAAARAHPRGPTTSHPRSAPPSRGPIRTRRSVPRALLLVMAVVTIIYFLVWAICTGTLATLAGSTNPVAEAARVLLGPIGGGLIASGILLSVLGVNANTALVAPREIYALAYRGYLPGPIASIHAVTRTPVIVVPSMSMPITRWMSPP